MDDEERDSLLKEIVDLKEQIADLESENLELHEVLDNGIYTIRQALDEMAKKL